MNKLEGIKSGDAVRVFCKGVVTTVYKDGGIGVFLEGGASYSHFDSSDVADPSFQIERIEPPIAVGDTVTWGIGGTVFEVVAIRGDWAILWNGKWSESKPALELRKAPPTPVREEG